MSTYNFDWKKYLKECMQSTIYCCLTTVDEEGVWANPVYFAWDSSFNFYFISQMPSRHMQNIKRDDRVAVAIYKTEQKDDIVGIQLQGTAQILDPELDPEKCQKKIPEAFDIYYGRAGKGPDVQQYINNPTWLFVKITPSNLYYFDTRFFGEERQTVPFGILTR